MDLHHRLDLIFRGLEPLADKRVVELFRRRILPDPQFTVESRGIEYAVCLVVRSTVCEGVRPCVRTVRWIHGLRDSVCCTGHWGGAADVRLDEDEDAWSMG